MISEKLKELREKSGMTQKGLADKLYVSPQAVSRWENGDTEPSVSTLQSLAEIFGVSLDELFGREAPAPKVVVEKETVYTAAPVVLGVCENCKKAITEKDDLILHTFHSGMRHNVRTKTCVCKSCEERRKKREHDQSVQNATDCRTRSFIWGSVLSAVILCISLGVTISQNMGAGVIVASAVVSVLFFPFLSCLFLQNNFIEDMFVAIAGFSVKLPGLIFELSLDGILWLITVKLALWILSIIGSVFAFLLAVALSLFVSIFVYPFSLAKSYTHPEETD